MMLPKTALNFFLTTSRAYPSGATQNGAALPGGHCDATPRSLTGTAGALGQARRTAALTSCLAQPRTTDTLASAISGTSKAAALWAPHIIDMSSAAGIHAGPTASTDFLKTHLEDAVTQHGAVLLRGLAVASAGELNALLRSLGYTLFEYEGLIVKLAKQGGAKPVVSDHRRLGLHTECSFLPNPPRKIIFLCQQPATTGGASLVGRVEDLMRALPADILADFARQGGVRYERWFPSPAQLAKVDCPFEAAKVAWTQWVGTTDRDVATRHFQDMGFTTRWDDGGGLHCTRTTAATVVDPESKAPLWQNFAQSPGVPPLFRVTFGNGAEIPPHVRERIVQALDEIAKPVMLDAGDILVLDNLRMMHGRDGYEGPRAIIQALTV